MDDANQFKSSCLQEIKNQADDAEFKDLTAKWVARATEFNYSYHFEWLGRPIIQYPQDMIGVQQLLWEVQPDLIIETGIARGGSLIYYASILELIAQCGGNQDAKIIGIDIDIREHNKKAIQDHPMSKRIQMLEGSSISNEVYQSILNLSKGYKKILVSLDSNHTHDHVLEELKLYGPLVSPNSYCVVFDSFVEDLPEHVYPKRPWGKSNNPKTAIYEYLNLLENSTIMANDGKKLQFEIDKVIENQLMITVAPDGFLKRK